MCITKLQNLYHFEIWLYAIQIYFAPFGHRPNGFGVSRDSFDKNYNFWLFLTGENYFPSKNRVFWQFLKFWTMKKDRERKMDLTSLLICVF